jgi:hypothetical protein
MCLSLTRFIFRVAGCLVRPEHARTLRLSVEMSLDPVDQSLSAIGQPEITSVAGLQLMSTRMKSRTLFLH